MNYVRLLLAGSIVLHCSFLVSNKPEQKITLTPTQQMAVEEKKSHIRSAFVKSAIFGAGLWSLYHTFNMAQDGMHELLSKYSEKSTKLAALITAALLCPTACFALTYSGAPLVLKIRDHVRKGLSNE